MPGERAIALTHDGALIRCSESVLRRFWSKVDRRGPGDCWPWKAYRCRHGRTKFRLGGIRAPTISGHRFAWILEKGPVPDGLLVIHRCPNNWCVNPDHMFLGTRADVGAELFRRGRTCFGERHHNAKLTTTDIQRIRALSCARPRPTVRQVASRFGITSKHVSDIWKLRLWTRVGGRASPFDDLRSNGPRRRPRRPPRPRCPDSTIRAILALKGGAFSLHEVARIFGVGKATVGRVWHGHRAPTACPAVAHTSLDPPVRNPSRDSFISM